MTTIGIVPAHCQGMKPGTPVSRLSYGVNEEDDMKIQEFMTWHQARVKKGRRDIPVKDLRHIIPAFILRCFGVKDVSPTQKKVKGLWDKPPSGWDTTVPFLDPNNKGDQGKPKKEVLMQMFEYLLKMYQGNGDTASDLTRGPIQESEMLTESEDTDEGRPVEVADDTDNYDWNPLEDCKQRIVAKLNSMQGETHLSRAEIGGLNVAKDVLFRLFKQLGKKDSLTHAHDYELTLDIVRATNSLPPEHYQKWHEFEGEGNKLNMSCTETMEKLQLLSDENFKVLGISTQLNPLMSGQTDDFSHVLSVRENLCDQIDWLDGVGTDNEDKFAVAAAIAMDDKTCVTPDATVEFDVSQLDFLLEDGDLSCLFNEGSSGDELDTSSGPDLTGYFNGDLEWSANMEPLKMPHNDNLILQDGGESCEDVHAPSLDYCVPPTGDIDTGDTDTGDVTNDDISIHQRPRHDSIDSDHSYNRKDEISSRVERMRISSPRHDAEQVERGTKRGYSEASNHLGPKHRRTEDMDIDVYGGDPFPAFGDGIPTSVESM